MITDHQYQQFMDKLGEDQRGKNPLILPDWEKNFLFSYRACSRPSLWFTEKRRQATDRMWRRLGPELNFPHPLDTVNEKPRVADADSAGCEFLVRDESRKQSRCNEPAVSQERRHGRPGLRYCQAHDEQVRQRCPGIVLVPFP